MTDDPVTITDWRQRRIEECLTFAKQILAEETLLEPEARYCRGEHVRFTKDLFSKAIFNYAKQKWRVSNALCNDYVITVNIILKKEIQEQAKIFHERKNKELGVMTDRYYYRSKMNIFMDTFKRLSGETKNDVHKQELLKALTESAQFADLEDIEKCFSTALREGQIYERKIDYFTIS